MAEIQAVKSVCVSCKKECGSHFCKFCKKTCHAIPPCSTSAGDDEGFGAQVLCSGCAKTETAAVAKNKQQTLSKEEFQFANMFKRHSKQQKTGPEAKRAKSGHEKTPMGFCLLCFRQGKRKFWLARGNKSSLANHLKTHSDKGEKTLANDAIREDSPLAKSALQAYKMLKSASTSQVQQSVVATEWENG
ncbi:uncharacterized protein LOC124438723 [Xenia sp. Carnegie-2017]|uniref:uncharacterized protein LOC124438723 n=1 Tax=Xenia sp. Carnegie-2017 TaxID=2897299 RepID=UPI001F0505A2|nr:uncharacterized protein LOC124438723 [Xenia sp. Carnegie-2017]